MASNFNGSNLPSAELYSLASELSWVDIVLNLTGTTTYSRVSNEREDDPLGYIVPFPPDYTTAMKAHWTTDIIVLDPSCNWQTLILADNQSLLVTLVEENTTLPLDPDYFGMFHLQC